LDLFGSHGLGWWPHAKSKQTTQRCADFARCFTEEPIEAALGNETRETSIATLIAARVAL
jgi:hypothetical protein